MAVQEKLYTADELWNLSDNDADKRYELDEGNLIEMSPSGEEHGLIAMTIGALMFIFVRQYKLGKVTAAETGYLLFSGPPQTVRAPDVGFISQDRTRPTTEKYYPVPPDLAVEVVSPNDTA